MLKLKVLYTKRIAILATASNQTILYRWGLACTEGHTLSFFFAIYLFLENTSSTAHITEAAIHVKTIYSPV